MNEAATVVLTFHEIFMGAMIGVARRLASLKRGETNKVQNKDFGWHSDIEAACAEIAVAKLLGVFWDGSINTFKAGDVGCLQVRHTQIQDGCLILRKNDDPSAAYVLVTGSHPTYLVCGFIYGRDGMCNYHVRDPNGRFPAWFVPQTHLRHMSGITQKLEKP